MSIEGSDLKWTCHDCKMAYFIGRLPLSSGLDRKAVIVEARIEFALLHKLRSDEFNDSKCGKRCH